MLHEARTALVLWDATSCAARQLDSPTSLTSGANGRAEYVEAYTHLQKAVERADFFRYLIVLKCAPSLMMKRCKSLVPHEGVTVYYTTN
jgi:hypothetical protein